MSNERFAQQHSYGGTCNDGSYYTINTAGAFKTSYGRNREIVYDRHTTVKQPAEVAVESQKPTQNGTSDNPRMNSSAQPDRKVTNFALHQINKGKLRKVLMATPSLRPARGIEVRGELDPDGQKIAQVVKSA